MTTVNTLAFEQIIVPLLPLYFLIRYLIKVRPKRRMIESWWLIGSNAVFAMLLLLGASGAIFGTTWGGRQPVREVVYGVIIAVFAAQIAWLEYRLRLGTAQIPPDSPASARAEKTIHRETP
jgi:hypothetical protein